MFKIYLNGIELGDFDSFEKALVTLRLFENQAVIKTDAGEAWDASGSYIGNIGFAEGF